jgi:hypothetical protein
LSETFSKNVFLNNERKIDFTFMEIAHTSELRNETDINVPRSFAGEPAGIR